MSKGKLPRHHVYMLITAYLASVVMGVVAVLYANAVDADSNRQWCGLVTTLDETYSSQQPSTDLGKRVARAISDLRDNFDC